MTFKRVKLLSISLWALVLYSGLLSDGAEIDGSFTKGPEPTCTDCVPVYYTGLNGSSCYRIPTIIQSSKGTLLAFAESRHKSCGDQGTHDLVVRRSTDEGKTWGPMITVVVGKVPCPGCPAAVSNPNPVEVTFADGTKALMLHYDTMNNPRPTAHGLDMQMWSRDDGLTWSNSTVLSFPPATNKGALIGPSVGIQAKSGIIYFSMVFGNSHWLYWSKDFGLTWTSSAPLSGLGECSITFLESAQEGTIIMNCRTGDHKRAQVIWSAEGIPGNITFPDGLIDPGCQGSITNQRGVLYTSNANTTTDRSHMTVKSSSDKGNSWSEGVLVYAGPSGYSQLVPLANTDHLGLLFEAGAKQTYDTISFVVVLGK